jgi:hypothetical protein
VLNVVTPLEGVTVTAESTGAVFSTLTLSAPLSLPPSVSVAVAVQVMLSLGEEVLLVRMTVELVPRLVVPLVQA